MQNLSNINVCQWIDADVHITAVVMAVHGNAEALPHCSCRHCQDKTMRNPKPCAIQGENCVYFFQCKCFDWFKVY